MKFEEIADDFAARTERIVWCSFATVDRAGRPRELDLTSDLGGQDGVDRHGTPVAEDEAPGEQPPCVLAVLGRDAAERERGGEGGVGGRR